MKFPTIAEVALELRQINCNVAGPCEVRLQVYPDGQWKVRWGLSDYDHDHRGYWGASDVPGVVKGVVKRFRSHELARDLIAECREAYAEHQAQEKPRGPRVGDPLFYAGREYTITEERRGFLLVGCVGLAFHTDDLWWDGGCARWGARIRVSCPVPE